MIENYYQSDFQLENYDNYLSDDQNENFSDTSQTTQPVPNQETNVNVNSDHDHQWDSIADVLWLHEDPTEEDQGQSPEIAQAILTPENNVRVELDWQDDQNENFSNTSTTNNHPVGLATAFADFVGSMFHHLYTCNSQPH